MAEGLGIQVARLSLATVRVLAAAGYGVTVVTADPASLAASSRDAARTVHVTPAVPETIAAKARELVDDGTHLTALAASDSLAIALEPWKAAWLDKRELDERARAAGLPVPETTVFEDAEALLAAGNDLPYPVFVKPAMGTVGVPCRGPADLRRVRDRTGPLLVQPLLEGALRAIGGVMWDGRLVASVHQRTLRTLPVTGGVATASITTEPDLALEERLAAMLAEVKGIFQVQLLDGYVIDVNLRPFGTVALSARAGANLPAIQCALVEGRRFTDTVRAKPWVRYRWLEGELRHLAARGVRNVSPREVLDALLPRTGAASGGVGSLRDPRPLVVRVRRAIRPLPPPDGSPAAVEAAAAAPTSKPTSGSRGRHGRAIVAGALGDRLSLTTLRALDAGGYSTTLVTSTERSPATASRSCHEVVLVEERTPAGLADATRSLLETGRFVAALAGNDRVMLELDPWKEPWTNKQALAEMARAAEVKHPVSTVFESYDALVAAADDLPYPCFVKPAIGRAGARCAGPADLARLDWIRSAVLVQPVLVGALECVSGVLWEGEVVAAVHHRTLRTMPPGGGVSTAAVTIEPDLDREREAVRLLSGVQGIFQVQYLAGYMIDVNLRCFGSLALSVKSGVNLPALFCDLVRGAGPDDVVRARTGVRYRWPQGEMRHVRARVKAHAIGPDLLDALLPRPFAATGSVFSLRDPGPFLARASHAGRAVADRLPVGR
ncbi:MAG: ATP-grasp domain-containing protein [Actinomycetota bacterium]